jgi:hypothetical protein
VLLCLQAELLPQFPHHTSSALLQESLGQSITILHIAWVCAWPQCCTSVCMATMLHECMHGFIIILLYKMFNVHAPWLWAH